MKTHRILLLCLLLTSSPLIVRADIVPTGQRPVTACFRLTNIDQYPAYVFVVYSRGRFLDRCSILRSGDCVGLGKQDILTIYAIDRQHVKVEVIKDAQTDEERERLRRYLESNPNLVKSGSISCSPFMAEADSAIRVEDILSVNMLSPDTLVVAYDSVKYTYASGRITKQPYVNQDERSRLFSSLEGVNPLWLAIGGISLIGLLIALYIRNRRY